MNILFYSPLQGRSKDTESLMEAFVKKGHSVFLLTQYLSPVYHNACTSLGVQCYASNVEGTDTFYKRLAQSIYFISFCSKFKIQIVYAQLEPATFIAATCQYFVRAKIVLVRHHVDLMETDSTRWAHFLSIISYRLARNIVVVSRMAKEYMIEKEKIYKDKIRVINIGYNFSLWPSIDHEFARGKRGIVNSDLILLTASRFVKSKRIDLSLHIVHDLRERGINCSLMLLGKGEEEGALKLLASELKIEDFVFFEGYVENIIDYIAAADVMLHFSLTESSATVIKEAGLARKPIIVCENVGDFDDYIKDGVNGYLVNKEFPSPQAIDLLEEFVKQPEKFAHLGENLFKSVINNFSVENVHKEYELLNKEAK